MRISTLVATLIILHALAALVFIALRRFARNFLRARGRRADTCSTTSMP